MIQQPVAMPLDLRDTTQGGKIYTPDPAAVARLRAILEDERQTRPTPLQSGTEKQLQRAVKRGGIKRNAAGVDTDLAERAEKLKAMREAKAAEAKTQESDMPELKLTDNDLLAAYRRYALEWKRVVDVAAEVGLAHQTLYHHFKRLGLPTRNAGDKWTAAQLETIREILGETPVKNRILFEAGYRAENGSTQHAETAVSQPVPVRNTEHAETAVFPTGSVTSDLPAPAHCGSDLAVMRDQLAALTALMDMAQAKRIQISGKIRLDLVAEIEL